MGACLPAPICLNKVLFPNVGIRHLPNEQLRKWPAINNSSCNQRSTSIALDDL